MTLITAEQKYLRMSPTKLRVVAQAVKGIQDPEKLLTALSFIKKRASLPLIKTIKQALGNAKNRGLTGDLRIKEVQIGEGPRHKRYRAGGRGRPKPILKRTSHIRVVLETKDEPTANRLQSTAEEKTKAVVSGR